MNATTAESVVRIAGVQYQEAGKIFDFDAGELELRRGDPIVVESGRGTTLATVIQEPSNLYFVMDILYGPKYGHIPRIGPNGHLQGTNCAF